MAALGVLQTLSQSPQLTHVPEYLIGRDRQPAFLFLPSAAVAQKLSSGEEEGHTENSEALPKGSGMFCNRVGVFQA